MTVRRHRHRRKALGDQYADDGGKRVVAQVTIDDEVFERLTGVGTRPLFEYRQIRLVGPSCPGRPTAARTLPRGWVTDHYAPGPQPLSLREGVCPVPPDRHGRGGWDRPSRVLRHSRRVRMDRCRSRIPGLVNLHPYGSMVIPFARERTPGMRGVALRNRATDGPPAPPDDRTRRERRVTPINRE